MIFSYLDDSSDDKRKAHVAIGGIIGHEIWTNLCEGNWIRETKSLKKPFRSTECECQHGQFANWKKPECDDLMRRLVGVLSDKRTGVGCYAFDVPVQLYRQVFRNSKEDDPMRLAVAHTIVEMARLARKHRERIRLWFEDGPFLSLIDKTYKDLKSLESWKWDQRGRLFGNISFGDKTLVPLQAADLVAREGFKLAANYGVRKFRKPVLGMWDRLGMGHYTREALELLREKGWPSSLDAITSLPDDCYLKEQKNYGSEFFQRPHYR